MHHGHSFRGLEEGRGHEWLAQAARKLEKAQGDFDRIKGMKPPSEAVT
jgi:hypothetical protein